MDDEQAERGAYHELCAYTLTHPDPSFIHQHVVDAFGAQRADEHTKPIGIAFALIGLYLCVEKNYSGRNVQRVHMLLARRRKRWPRFELPEFRGEIRVRHVLAASPGPDRDAMIRTWCASVWDAYGESRDTIVSLLQTELP